MIYSIVFLCFAPANLTDSDIPGSEYYATTPTLGIAAAPVESQVASCSGNNCNSGVMRSGPVRRVIRARPIRNGMRRVIGWKRNHRPIMRLAGRFFGRGRHCGRGRC